MVKLSVPVYSSQTGDLGQFVFQLLHSYNGIYFCYQEILYNREILKEYLIRWHCQVWTCTLKNKRTVTNIFGGEMWKPDCNIYPIDSISLLLFWKFKKIIFFVICWAVIKHLLVTFSNFVLMLRRCF